MHDGPPGAGALAGVVGFPVGHSRSPAMHNAGYAALGLDWRYLKLPVAPDRFAETVRALPASGYRGVNVTVPHKLAALELADDAAPPAAAIGAANTLTFREDGLVSADNTDAQGFLDALGADQRGVRALVLGAGGAGRAVAWALREAGAGDVAIWNRSPERATALAHELGIRRVAAPEPGDLLVNATTVGLEAGVDEPAALEALGLTRVEPFRTVVDLVYSSEVTPVAAWGARAGSRVVDGLEVLVRQGALSFELWTGMCPPLDVLRGAVRAAGPPATR